MSDNYEKVSGYFEKVSGNFEKVSGYFEKCPVIMKKCPIIFGKPYNNIPISFKKSRFLTRTAKFLGSIIEGSSIRADISNLNEAKFEVPPKTLKQLR